MGNYKNKHVLFVTTKNLDYIRNSQEIRYLKEHGASVSIIGSNAESYGKRLLKVYSKLLFTKAKNYDLCFVGFAPQLVIPLFYGKFKKKTLVIDFFISMYDTLVFDRKKFRPDSIPAKLLKWIDKKTIQAADEVISDTKAHGEYFIQEFGLERKKLQVLYLEADTSIYYNRSRQKPNRLSNQFVVLYFGSVLPLQGLDVILDAIQYLKDRNDIHFIIVGPVSESYHKPLLDTVEYHNWLSQEQLAEYISYADLCLAGHFNKDIAKAKRTIPGKAYIYSAMEKPMILGDNAATHELYDTGTPGIYFVKMGDAKALADKILEISNIV